MERTTELLTIGEAAAELRLGRSFVYANLIASGQLPTVRISPRAVRVRRVDLLAWIDRLSATPSASAAAGDLPM
jgi:excisionase family DNA binding protein